jgi:hypothetical protein
MTKPIRIINARDHWEVESDEQIAGSLVIEGFLPRDSTTSGPNKYPILLGKEIEVDTYLRNLGVEVDNPYLMEIKEIESGVWELYGFSKVLDADFILQEFLIPLPGTTNLYLDSDLDVVAIKPDRIKDAANYLTGRGFMVRIKSL